MGPSSRLVVGITGATGAVLGVRLLEQLAAADEVETHLVLSRWARTTLELETGHPAREVAALADVVHPPEESLYLGMPWTEIDYLMAANTCVPIHQQLRADFPEVQAVNAMYTHGLLAIISTRKRYGGFAKAVGMRAMTTPHGLGYVKTVILVDEDVDPFDLPQVMWAVSAKVNPAGDLVNIPNLSVVGLDPGAQPAGVTNKMIVDATTPVAPDDRGNYGTPVRDLPEAAEWVGRLKRLRDGRS